MATAQIQGNIIEKKGGWITAHIYGEPYDRGFAHGFLLKDEFQRIQITFPFLVKEEIGVSFSKYMEASKRMINPILKKDYSEFYDEIRGISDGAKAGGVDVSVDYLIAWNSYVSLYSHFKDGDLIRCSAFIATGNATEKGDIVMAHNTHCDFATAQVFNIMLYLTPSEGTPFVMQTCAGYIASATDWFICANGLIGCETTISQINYKPKFGSPYFCRIREAMQYGRSLDDYVKIMLKNNAGDYACSWLFGNIKTSEIMLFEIGLKVHSVQRTKNGVFYGMNSAIDYNLRSQETTDHSYADITTSSGSRNYRLNELLNKQYYGKINLSIAKKVLSDHYDVFLGKETLSSRCICKHTEADDDAKKANYPFGCTDAKIVDSKMAKEMHFWAKFGSSCDRDFNVDEFIKTHPKYSKWKKVLIDMPPRHYVEIKNKPVDKSSWISMYLPSVFTEQRGGSDGFDFFSFGMWGNPGSPYK